MNEIDLVRRFRAETSTPDERETQRARGILLAAIGQDRNRAPSLRERLHRAPRRTVALALAVIALPGSYAIADSTGVLGGGSEGTVTLTPETAIPASAPGSESDSTIPAPPASEPLSIELRPSDPGLGADVAVPDADESDRRGRARRGTVDLTPDTAVPTKPAGSK